MESALKELIAAIEPASLEAQEAAAVRLDSLTKPPGSLGKLEETVQRIAAIRRGGTRLFRRKCIVVMAADHGIVEEGVSAYPADVTAQMVLNFLRGGAAINVLARHAGAEVVVVDIGVGAAIPPSERLIDRKLALGTMNFTSSPAMTPDEAELSLLTGAGIASDLFDGGCDLIGTGDMGIGNTTPSSAIASAILRRDPVELTGVGTGIDEAGLARKIAAIRKGLAANKPDPSDGIDVLAKVGGFEIGGLAGVMLAAAARQTPVVIDGFISGAAALVATLLAPHARDYMIASHRSVEAGHAAVLAHLRLTPLLDLNLRLGEGTGAALAFPIIEAGLKIMNEMATFAEAGVSGKR